MFDAGAPFLFFDYLRIPYRVSPAATDPAPRLLDGCGWARWSDEYGCGTTLLWADSGRGHGRRGRYQLAEAVLFASLLEDATVRRLLAEDGRQWSERTPITDAAGQQVGAVWESEDGDVLLPFDPAEVMQSYWSERYHGMTGSSAVSRGRKSVTALYYRLRPVLPRPVQIAARQVFSHLQSRSRFPRWPIESSLHDFYAWLLDLLAERAQVPVPYIAPWPDGYSWALVLTHDVETAQGVENMPPVRELETEYGYRSSWNFVPKRYEVPEELTRELVSSGFEVGVHGLYHDGRDLVPSQLDKRLPVIRDYADRWQAQGFRSPATLRDCAVMPTLGFDYDSSYPDTDPYEPQPGGCCTWLPFLNEGMVELPITLPQDHTLFVILESTDAQVWFEKADFLRSRGGLALLDTHPDYLLEGARLDAYRSLLERYHRDDSAWRALPADVAAWWRRRSESSLELDQGTWRVTGPAAGEGAVRFAAPAGAVRAAGQS